MDAPDWVLSEIAVLSKVVSRSAQICFVDVLLCRTHNADNIGQISQSSVRIKLMAVQIVSGLQGLPLDDSKLYKLTTDSGLDVSETKAAVAALEHIMACAAR
jgi:hypothetical protein